MHGRSFLVECYWPGVTRERFSDAAGRVDHAARELVRRGGDVKLVDSILMPADETVFCLFDGCEPDVLAASNAAGLPVERICESIRLRADGGVPLE